MDKLIPKNFILWRPKALLLLIFLEVVFARTGSERGFEKMNDYAGPGGYKEPCEGNWDCQHQFICHPVDKECTCNNRLSSRLSMVYSKKSKSCVSVVGKVCTMKAAEKEELHPIGCVPDAECVRKPGFRLSTTLGTCECVPGFEATLMHMCERVKIIQFGDEAPIFAMAGPGAPQKYVGSRDGEFNPPPVQKPAKGATAEKSEGTTAEDIDVPKSFRYEQDDLHSGSAQRGLSSNSSIFPGLSAQTRILSGSSIFNTLVIITLHLVLWR